MKNLNYICLIFSLIFISQKNYAQDIIASNLDGKITIKKSTPITTSIVTEQMFSYNVEFQDLDENASQLDIWDIIPNDLEIVPPIFANPDFLDHNGNLVPFGSLGGTINVSTPRIDFVNLENYSTGSFTINVKFPGGVTPNGVSVTNNICATYNNGTGIPSENICTTDGLTSTSHAISPWGTITKEPLYPAIEDSNGDFHIPRTGGVANYRIIVEKNPAYRNQTFGMLNLTNVNISEMFLSCTSSSPSISLLSGPGTLNASNAIVLNNDLRGHIPNERAIFIVQVDYSGCTLTNGQIINNTVELNGTPLGENPQQGIASATAQVIASDSIVGVLGSVKLSKSVQISNRVPGCKGEYIINYTNTDNRPISLINITDILPNDITPQSIYIYGSSNNASLTNSYSLTINNGTASTITIPPGYNNPNPWNSTNNSIELKANSSTVLHPYEYIQIRIPFTINTNLTTGTIVTNCATATGSIIDTTSNINEQLNEQRCASFTIQDPEVKLCLLKKVRKANTGTGFANNITNIIPTDELEFQICFQNNGSLDFSGQLTDVLDAKYDFVSVVSDNFPSGTTFNPPTAANGNTLTWSNIIAPQSCSNFSIVSCPGSGQMYCAVIKVKVKPYTQPGNIDNVASLNGNIPNVFDSNTAKVNIIESSVVKLEKEISENLISFSTNLTVNPNITSSVYYRIKVTNLGNMPVLQHQIIDEMPGNGDVRHPSTSPRNSNFSLTNYIDASSPNYTASYLNTNPRASGCISPGNSSSNSATKSIVYNSNSPSLNPGDSNTIIIKADLPSGLRSGDVACNSSYFLNCGTQSGIVRPSNNVCLDVYIPPCTSCEDDGNFEAFTQSNSLINIPETGVHSEVNGIPVYTENYTLKTDWNWITKVRIVVSEFEPIISEDCESCNYNMEQTGNLVYNMFPNQLGNLTKESIQYSGANQNFVREIVYSGLPDTSFLAGVTTNLALAIPDLDALACCPSNYKVCLKFIFEGPNCENCEVEYCTVLEEGSGPIFGPEPCPEIFVDAWEFIKSKDCCSKTLAFKTIGCDTQATYKIKDSNNVIVVQGTVTGPTMAVPISQNGTYTVEVACLCTTDPAGVITATSNPVTISGLIGAPPTTSQIISNSITRTGNGSTYTANLDFSINSAYYKYGFNVTVQQAYKGAFSTTTTDWVDINHATFNKDVCAENGVDFNFNFPINKPGLRENILVSPNAWIDFEETWEDKYQIVISWKACNGVTSSPISIPLSNAGPISIYYNPSTGTLQNMNTIRRIRN